MKRSNANQLFTLNEELPSKNFLLFVRIREVWDDPSF